MATRCESCRWAATARPIIRRSYAAAGRGPPRGGGKYGAEVRVLSMGRNVEADYSVELCGGTHVTALGDIQLFKIVAESAVSSGVRRIEALTGEAARQWLLGRDQRLRDAAAALKSAPEDVP